ncbi:AAA family ATPase [Streptomyces lydicus]|uniref:AAA family ATPase n=1 Tax=Streptomyces lydicus TaxID=47763 RepID=UPI00378BF986
MFAKEPENVAVVSGDAVADWVIAYKESESRRTMGAKWQAQNIVTQHEIPGGARLLAKLVEKVKSPEFEVLGHKWGNPARNESVVSHHYATLMPYPVDQEIDVEKESNFRWRVAENFGMQPNSCTGKHGESCSVDGDAENAKLLILVDSGLGYYEKHDPPKTALTHASEGEIPWFLVKFGGDKLLSRENSLWQEILPQYKDKVVLVTTADDLRQFPKIEISQGTAWELAASDCARLVADREELNRYRFVIVSFGPAGVLLFDRDKPVWGGAFSLFFDVARVEGTSDFWLNGKMWGYTSALTAAIAHKLMVTLEKNEEVTSDVMSEAMRRGIKAMLTVYKEGFGPVVSDDEEKKRQAPDFPLKEVSEAIKFDPHAGGAQAEDDVGEVQVEVEKPPARSMGLPPSWTILGDKTKDLHEAARNVVYDGVAALKNVPRLKYGKVTTVDRREIESFQSVRVLVRDYAERRGTRVQRWWEKGKTRTPAPLSIAIFGAPGSGKSTAVKEVIASLKVKDREFKFEEFNLSQFRDTAELIGSFHRLRDDRLTGTVPIVLWDEFDTALGQELGWLRYFLSPMQDGTFQEGSAVHPIGRSVFVFAGGVSRSLQDFKSRPGFDVAKGPDFLSRVQGIMELQGIDKDDDDEHWVIRRAILLRSILEQETQIVTKDESARGRIDPDVLNAFLSVPKFHHGVRSMRAIVVNSSLSGEYYYGRSALPNETQLDLHVNAVRFYKAMEREEG